MADAQGVGAFAVAGVPCLYVAQDLCLVDIVTCFLVFQPAAMGANFRAGRHK